MNFKFFSKCEGCRKRRFFISKKKITIPTGAIAKSQKLLYTPCIRVINKAISL